MWLLSTDRAELHYFSSPDQVPGGYAILSHLWDDHELSLRELRALTTECAQMGTNPRDRVPRKLRMACTLARQHGYAWLWADTCCIDKTSQTELSEALNAMFRFYALSAICYAYLRDVPSDSSAANGVFFHADFTRSLWHRRGWTLPELLAPKLVVFLSSDWKVLGTKSDHATLLHDITRIPVPILRGEQDMAELSVAQRMSWAANRETTRPEDEAYCLMGIFGVNMPVLYGEGEKAFYRLQEAIMKTTSDPSLFFWGPVGTYKAILSRSHRESSHNHISVDSYLLAPSPTLFKSVGDGSGVNYAPPMAPAPPHHKSVLWKVVCKAFVKSSRRQVGAPTFTITPRGILVHTALVKLSSTCFLALFSCSDAHGATALALTPCPSSFDPHHPIYHFGAHGIRRVSQLGYLRDRVNLDELPKPRWKSFYVIPKPPFRADPDSPRSLSLSVAVMNTTITSPFRIDLPSVAIPNKRADGTATSGPRPPSPRLSQLVSPAVSPIPFGWMGNPPVTLKLYEGRFIGRKRTKGVDADGALTYCLYVTLGICWDAQRAQHASDGTAEHGSPSHSPSSPRSSPLSGRDPDSRSSPLSSPGSPTGPIVFPHWAAVSMRFYDTTTPPPAEPPAAPHSCPGDHISTWPELKKRFSVELAPDARTRHSLYEHAPLPARGPTIMDFELSFAPCALNPAGWTLVMRYPRVDFYY
ncbi:HET-domain-containing protein [Epithele typhae]|uniref:HET-domain-containing protein n=1 Tax=Epithele typhae TaxID=378194 RepID=UPI002007DD0D|nr:HET-domain-containing protein [Epithele typhae]KAH9911279.1 HET-domain-containing protein [Epithele typhae]